MVARKTLEFTAKIDFPIGHFLLPNAADANIGSLKSLHILFNKYLDYILVQFIQNRMVQTIQNFELFRQKMVIHFGNVCHFFRRFCE